MQHKRKAHFAQSLNLRSWISQTGFSEAKALIQRILQGPLLGG